MAVEAVAIFLSAFLLFEVEPLIAKAILPWFGGASAVWTTCLLFFQAALLGGYLYAHVLSRRPARTARAAHAALLAVSVALLAAAAAAGRAPILPPAALRPSGPETPVVRVLASLAAGVGLPFFVLSSTGPLLQSWIARRRPQARVFRLFALSNLASLAALFAYPFVIEPAIGLARQAWIWAALYVLCAGLLAVCAFRAASSAPAVAAQSTDDAIPSEPDAAIRPSRRLFWLALAACPSALLLAATNQMCQEVAAIPFLWVLPLALYLLSFVLCFQSDRLSPRAVFGPLLVGSLGYAAWILYRGYGVPIRQQVLADALAVFAVCMVCHGELARSRPAPRQATSFYLMVAAGGVAGAVFVAVVAPLLFPAFWEFHLLLWLSAVAAIFALVRDTDSWLHRGRVWPALLTLFALAVLAWQIRDPDRLASMAARARRAAASGPGAFAALTAVALLAFAAPRFFRLRARPYFVAACLAGGAGFLGFALVADVRGYVRGALALSRNFYGVLTIEALDSPDPQLSRLSLRNGRIVHGFQYQSSERRREPTTYYGRASGIGLLLDHPPGRAPGGPRRVAVVGLGAGTLAAYGRPGDVYRFYDINPDVIRLSTGNAPRFTYLAESRARVEIAPGDARRSLERELASNAPPFDVIAVDAFTSDAIPVHLLTREAIALYMARLRPDGVLALHVSNRQLDLLPVARAAADALALEASLIDTNDDGEGCWGATWVLLAREPGPLEPAEIEQASAELPRSPRVRLWTDDYSNLFQVLK
ncbi:MAG TPA: fused MFS/spermidine synthase [Thermoanaerobaculia bacterium]